MSTTTRRRPSKATGKGQSFYTLVTFDTSSNRPNVRFLREGIAFDDAPVLTYADYAPHGGTPLYDATKATIYALDRAVAEKPDGVHFAIVLDESGSMGHLRQSVIDGANEFVNSLRGQKPEGEGRVMMVLFTDGYENASETTAEEIQGLIKEREAIGWDIVYMGANQDAQQAARGMGIDVSKPGSYFNYTATRRGTQVANAAISSLSVGYLAEDGKANLRSQASALGDTLGGEPDIPVAPSNVAAAPREQAGSAYDLSDVLKKARGEGDKS
jgi:hypothetical protein